MTVRVSRKDWWGAPEPGDVRLDREGRVVKVLGRKYSPDQPRVPSGSPEGGRWTSTGVQAFGYGEEAYRKIKDYEDSIRDSDFETCACFDSNGRKVFEKFGEASEITFSDQEIKRMKGGNLIFTHNHPKSSSFSIEDIPFGANIEAAEMRVIAKNGMVYRMIPPRMESGKLRWDNPGRLQEIIADFDRSVRDDFWPRVRAGTLTPERANATHHRELWKRFSSKYRGYEYIEETP